MESNDINSTAKGENAEIIYEYKKLVGPEKCVKFIEENVGRIAHDLLSNYKQEISDGSKKTHTKQQHIKLKRHTIKKNTNVAGQLLK